MQASLLERLLSALATAITLALLGYLLLVGMTVERQERAEEQMAILALQASHPQRRRPPPHVDQRPRSAASSKPSPRNLRNRAAAIITPPPPVPPPIPSSIVSAPTAGLGMAASAGASDRPGPGEGAGGRGTGTGGGGAGDGEGGGGDDVPPRLIKGRLKFSDLPPDLRDGGIGGTVSVRYEVAIDGRVSDCIIIGSSGSTELDQLTCRLIEQRFRFDPSRDHEGRPVPSAIEENHSWENDRTRLPRPER